MQRARTLCALAVILGLSLSARAADEVKLDRSTPKKAVAAFYDLVAAGKIAEFESCFVAPTDDAERDLAKYGVSDDIYAPYFRNALVAKFGAENVKSPDLGRRFASMMTFYDKWDVTIEGDTATLKPPPPKPAPGVTITSMSGPAVNGFVFKKVGDDWKFPITEGIIFHKFAPTKVGSLDNRKEQLAAYTDTVKDIEAGKFKSAEEATKALEDRRHAAIEKYNK